MKKSKKANKDSVAFLVEKGADRLRSCGVFRPVNESFRLMAEVLNSSLVELKAGFVKTISREQKVTFENYINKRASGFPLQYISRRAFFMGLEFFIDGNVLIPRNETEILALESLKHLRKKEKSEKILELGTGSGCIAVWLAASSGCAVHAVDISGPALKIAEKNAVLHGVQDKVEYVKADMLNPRSFARKSCYDIIVSNPPYVSESEYRKLPEEVKKEPSIALKAGKEGLKYIEFIIESYREYVKPGGKILIEIGYSQKESVKKIAGGQGEFVKDMSGVERVFVYTPPM